MLIDETKYLWSKGTRYTFYADMLLECYSVRMCSLRKSRNTELFCQMK